MVQGLFSEGSSVLLYLFCIQGKGCRERSLTTGSNNITDILKKELEQTVGDIFKTRFTVAKGNHDEKIKKMTGSGLVLKRKFKPKNFRFQGKERGEGYFAQEKKNRK